MGNTQDFQNLIADIQAIPQEEVKTPHMPVDVYLQESEFTYHWALDDKEKFDAIGFDWALVESIPVRAGACREAQSLWMKEMNTREQAERQWKEQSPEAFDLRDKLVHDFRFAYRKRSDLLTNINAIAEGGSNADMIQDLNDLAVLGKDNLAGLEAINYDVALLDQAATMADEMANILAMANGERGQESETKVIRDKAYTYLKQAVDEVREAGKYLFWRDKDRLKGYASQYIRRQNNSKSSDNVIDEEPAL